MTPWVSYVTSVGKKSNWQCNAPKKIRLTLGAYLSLIYLVYRIFKFKLTAHIEEEPIWGHKQVQFQGQAKAGKYIIRGLLPLPPIQVGTEGLLPRAIRCLIHHTCSAFYLIII